MPQLNRRSDCTLNTLNTLNTLRALFTLALLIAFADARPAVAQTLFATFIGGATEESVRDIAFDSAGNLYVTGGTGSADFPTTDGTTINPGANGASFGGHDVWVAKYSPSGVLLWCTAFGGDGERVADADRVRSAARPKSADAKRAAAS